MRPQNVRGAILLQSGCEVVDSSAFPEQQLRYWTTPGKEPALQRPRRRLDRQLRGENVRQHLKPRNSNKTFRIYQHITLLLFMRKLAFSSTWRSHLSLMIFTRIPWTSLACEEQSLFLFYSVISIKLCCWLGTSRTVFEKSAQNGKRERKKSRIRQHEGLRPYFILVFLFPITSIYLRFLLFTFHLYFTLNILFNIIKKMVMVSRQVLFVHSWGGPESSIYYYIKNRNPENVLITTRETRYRWHGVVVEIIPVISCQCDDVFSISLCIVWFHVFAKVAVYWALRATVL